MAFVSQDNLHCPVCQDIFQDPVLLSCSHSFCKACLQGWWTQNTNQGCPVCRESSSQSNPPRNLALKSVCDAVLLERMTGGRCSLHSEELKLFCLNDQQPVCVVCLHSETHKDHSFRTISEAARDNKEELQELLRSLQNKLDLFNDMKVHFDQTAEYIDVQAEDTETQITDVFSILRKVLEKEETARITALREEKQQKKKKLRRKSEGLKRDIEALSDTIRGTEEVLSAGGVSFLQNYNTAAELVNCVLLNEPQAISDVCPSLDVDKHLKNLAFNILDKMKTKVTHGLDQRTAGPDATVLSLRDSLYRLELGDRWV